MAGVTWCVYRSVVFRASADTHTVVFLPFGVVLLIFRNLATIKKI